MTMLGDGWSIQSIPGQNLAQSASMYVHIPHMLMFRTTSNLVEQTLIYETLHRKLKTTPKILNIPV